MSILLLSQSIYLPKALYIWDICFIPYNPNCNENGKYCGTFKCAHVVLVQILKNSYNRKMTRDPSLLVLVYLIQLDCDFSSISYLVISAMILLVQRL